MNLLSNAWLRMIREMEAVKMAHGDLDLTNIRVQFEHPGIELELYIDELCFSLHEHRLPSSLDSIVPPLMDTIVITKATSNDAVYNLVQQEAVTNSTTSVHTCEIVFCSNSNPDFI